MYCPNCKQEFPGKFCPECGAKLVELPKQNDLGINISDDAAIMGGVNVTRNEQGALALLFIHARKLTCMRGFTRALQTYHHDNGGRLGRNGKLGL